MTSSGRLRRFAAVGIVNTALDFGILFALRTLGTPVVTANIISSTIAFIFSFFANKKFTFKTSGTNIRREMTLFIIITLFGLWVVQTIVIQFSLPLFQRILSDQTALLASKLVATVASLVWNYVLYNRVVFTHASSADSHPEHG